MVNYMTKLSIPHSVKKFLRREKARIRRDTPDASLAEKKIWELVGTIAAPYNRKK